MRKKTASFLAFILFPFLPCFSGKSREFVVENDTSYACGKKKPIFPENRCPFPKNHNMVKKMYPARKTKFERESRTQAGHTAQVQYIAQWQL